MKTEKKATVLRQFYIKGIALAVAVGAAIPAYCVPTPSRTWVSARYVMRGNVPVWEPGHWVVQ